MAATGTDAKSKYIDARFKHINSHFAGAIGVDELVARAEAALYGFGFTGENSIALSNLCRDESTAYLRNRIENVFGASFSTQSLGAVPTFGLTGLGAGTGHSPTDPVTGKERYVFFSFPHIAIDATGKVGPIVRPGRPKVSGACGALVAALGHIGASGVEAECKNPGTHDPLDIEYSILKQKMARQLKTEGVTDVSKMNLVDFTKVCERLVTQELREMIAKGVDSSKADWALITGVQIHSWAGDAAAADADLEFVWPTEFTVCVGGKETKLEWSAVPKLPPRQMAVLAAQQAAPFDVTGELAGVCAAGAASGIARPERLAAERAEADKFAKLLK
ncbi:unnamed protein product [Pedinophyceae sp. YPF-701]|nr:unnamed protein product [Pedinophyceae sp. YPF-701]